MGMIKDHRRSIYCSQVGDGVKVFILGLSGEELSDFALLVIPGSFQRI